MPKADEILSIAKKCASVSMVSVVRAPIVADDNPNIKQSLTSTVDGKALSKRLDKAFAEYAKDGLGATAHKNLLADDDVVKVATSITGADNRKVTIQSIVTGKTVRS